MCSYTIDDRETGNALSVCLWQGNNESGKCCSDLQEPLLDCEANGIELSITGNSTLHVLLLPNVSDVIMLSLRTALNEPLMYGSIDAVIIIRG